MRVRRAAPGDAAAVAGIHVRSWQAAYRGLMPDELLDGLSVAEREGMWREIASGRAEGHLLFVAERDGQLVGFCALAAPGRDDDAGDDEAEIGALYVDPESWRSGAGRALIDVALSHLRSAGWREVTLWVLRDNQPALDFYAAHQFRPDGAERLYERSNTTGIRLRRSLRAQDSH